MSESPFDPYSPNAMFSRIIERLDQQDRDAVAHQQDIKQTITTFQTDLRDANGRILSLEHSAWRQRGAVAVIALAIPMLWQWVTKKP